MKKTASIVLLIVLMLSVGLQALATQGGSVMPENQDFREIWGLTDITDIHSGVIVRNDGKCADILPEDLQEWFSTYWNFSTYDRVIAPKEGYYYDEGNYIKLWNRDKTKAYIVYPNSGVIAGRYGEPCESHGETKELYVWYMPYIGNAKNALYMADTELSEKYIFEFSPGFVDRLRDVTPQDAEFVPENNCLITEGADLWAVPEIERAAACNLLPYELAERYTESISRMEFCGLIYRLIATEFSPQSDSRTGLTTAIFRVMEERGLQEAAGGVTFSDCEDDKIKFLSAAGIINGMGDGSFAPEAFLTREQAATILYRTAEFLRNKTMIRSNDVSLYDDAADISDWAKSAVSSMKAMDIMKGVSEREFAPKGSYTKEQAIATMVRLYECY